MIFQLPFEISNSVGINLKQRTIERRPLDRAKNWKIQRVFHRNARKLRVTEAQSPLDFFFRFDLPALEEKNL